ncbi:MAG: cyclic-di-AMP receptor [Chloroflexota bacterium]|nr:cyclic-di-AMP receptor [Chloroflexota bacterium]
MKMVMAVVPRDEAGRVLEGLVAAGHTATFSDSRGGMLRQAQQMLFIAVEDEDLKNVLNIIHENCHSQVAVGDGETGEPFSLETVPGTAKLGGAVIFIWELERQVNY